MKIDNRKKQSLTDSILKIIEIGCNKLPSPFTMFIELFLIIGGISAVCSYFHVTAVNPSTQEKININNFFSQNGLNWFLKI